MVNLHQSRPTNLNPNIRGPQSPLGQPSRVKTGGALDALPNLKVIGRICLDLGASTGGFTQVLLARGAAQVIAVDVGRNQLHPILLLDDARVLNRPQTDVRTLKAKDFSSLPDLLVSDLSFIALEKALPAALDLAPAKADLIALFKPQFQVGRDHLASGGIVRDQTATEGAFTKFQTWLKAQGWPLAHGRAAIEGSDGNQELWVWAKKR